MLVARQLTVCSSSASPDFARESLAGLKYAMRVRFFYPLMAKLLDTLALKPLQALSVDPRTRSLLL